MIPRERRLPERYEQNWRTASGFTGRVRPLLREGARILDVGAGARPTIAVGERPPRCHYVGLDASASELAKAPAGSYDEVWEHDVRDHLPPLRDRFDLAVSWQALEHVRPIAAAVENVRLYLRPGGKLVALVSGAFAVFALANRLVPRRIGVSLMGSLIGRDPDSVFPADYDRCWHGALGRLLRPWSDADVLPLFRGAEYFDFSPSLQSLYVRYEEWARRGGHANLATHYLIDATR